MAERTCLTVPGSTVFGDWKELSPGACVCALPTSVRAEFLPQLSYPSQLHRQERLPWRVVNGRQRGRPRPGEDSSQLAHQLVTRRFSQDYLKGSAWLARGRNTSHGMRSRHLLAYGCCRVHCWQWRSINPLALQYFTKPGP